MIFFLHSLLVLSILLKGFEMIHKKYFIVDNLDFCENVGKPVNSLSVEIVMRLMSKTNDTVVFT